MPETQPEKSAEQPAPVRETAAAAPAPASKTSAHSHGEHGGVYSRFREVAAQSGNEPPPEQFIPIFRKSEFSHPVNDGQKARVIGEAARRRVLFEHTYALRASQVESVLEGRTKLREAV